MAGIEPNDKTGAANHTTSYKDGILSKEEIAEFKKKLNVQKLNEKIQKTLNAPKDGEYMLKNGNVVSSDLTAKIQEIENNLTPEQKEILANLDKLSEEERAKEIAKITGTFGLQ